MTLAHLFWRRVAANAPAIPFLPDVVYNTLFPQKAGIGLTELGTAAVQAMYRERMLIDLSHMRSDSVEQTFALLDRLDRGSGAAPTDHPVISSHAGFRFGKQVYNHDEATVRQIAQRGGVIGLIFAQHQLNDGVRKKTKTLEESLEVIGRHIDRIRDITGTHEHVAIGSDFDGFIKPTLGGLERSSDIARLSSALVARYGAVDAERSLAGNALRVLQDRAAVGRRNRIQESAGTITSAVPPIASAATPSADRGAPPSSARPAPVSPASRSLNPSSLPRSAALAQSASWAVAATKERFQPIPSPNSTTAVATTESTHSRLGTETAITNRPPANAGVRPMRSIRLPITSTSAYIPGHRARR